MVTAIVLMNAENDKVHVVAEALVDMVGVKEVYSVGGQYDLVAVLRVPDDEALEELVAERIRGVEGIERSETPFAFRVYSRRDLESMFAIGMEA